ncbi:MAG: SPOR domain-containing protein [Bacillota bacterium]|nr:SPOR domain-containing protein [Bacillota bacterium]
MYQKRRGGRRSFPQRRRVKPNYVPVVVILCMAIGCGYVTAKYVVDPVVNYVPELVAEKQQEETKDDSQKQTEAQDQKEDSTADVVEDDVKVEETGKVTGYALQFGCYSSQEAAEKAMSSLGVTGLRVLKQNKMYKIVGDAYDTKKEARSALEELPETANAFVTTLYEQ